MAQTWLRLDSDILLHRKFRDISSEDGWDWIALLCIALKANKEGIVGDTADIAFVLRSWGRSGRQRSDSDIEAVIERLVERRLLDPVAGGKRGRRFCVHNWTKYQVPSRASKGKRTENPRAHAGTDIPTNKPTDSARRRANEQAASPQEPASPDFFDDQSDREKAEPQPSTGRLFPDADAWSRPVVHPPSAKTHLEHADYVWAQIEKMYRGLGLPERMKGAKAIWDGLDADEQRATVTGYFAWHQAAAKGERKDPKFVEALPKLMTNGALDQPLDEEEQVLGPGGRWIKVPNVYFEFLQKLLAGPAKRGDAG